MRRGGIRSPILPIFAMLLYIFVMTTMNISLPDTLKSFVDSQVSRRGFGTSSEYMRALIRKDQERQVLKDLLLDGAASPATAPVTDEYFNSLRDRIRIDEK